MMKEETDEIEHDQEINTDEFDSHTCSSDGDHIHKKTDQQLFYVIFNDNTGDTIVDFNA